MPVPQKLREVNQTTIGNLICYFFAILIVSITTGITIRIAITMAMLITVETTITIGMRMRISVGIIIIIGERITTGIICIRKMGITVIIKIGFTITISITIQITILKRTITSSLTVVGKRGRQTHGRTHNIFFAYSTG
jgi:hypothetical protein